MNHQSSRVSGLEAEQANLGRFLQAYEKKFHYCPRNPVHRDRPDFELTDPCNNLPFGLELTSAYQDEIEVKINYSLEGEENYVEGNLEGLLQNLQTRISEKAVKSFSYEYPNPFHLAIWLGSFTYSEMQDVDVFSSTLLIPSNRFTHIWLIAQDDEDYSPVLYQLQ